MYSIEPEEGETLLTDGLMENEVRIERRRYLGGCGEWRTIKTSWRAGTKSKGNWVLLIYSPFWEGVKRYGVAGWEGFFSVFSSGGQCVCLRDSYSVNVHNIY